MAENRGQPRVNPILKKLTSRGKGRALTQLKGFVGEGPKGFVRIYPSLTMPSYVDIHSDDVVHFIESDEDDKPIEIFVRASAKVNFTQVRSGTTEAQNLDGLGKGDCGCGCGGQTVAALRIPPGSVIGPDTPRECYRDCAFAFRDCLRSGRSYSSCVADDDLCNARCDAIFPTTGTVFVR